MLKAIWVGIILTIVISVTAVLKWGIHPQPVSIIGASRFATPQRIGETTFDQLLQLVRSNQVLVIGGMPNSVISQQIALGFINRAESLGVHFSQVLAQAGQFPVLKIAKSIQFNADLDQIAQMIEHLQPNQRLLILTVNNYISHLLKSGPMRRLEKMVNHPVASITLGPLALNPNEIDSLTPPCVGPAQNASGTQELGCAILSRSRALFHHKLQPQDIIMTLDQEGLVDYLLLVHAPGNAG